ncbi:MAG: DUF600 family protein [Rhodocyclales bacterium]|nr:DUF600 family protein [Rhodocyclales bacterium]
MNPKVQELQTTIAQGIWNVMPKPDWVRASFEALAIKPYFSASGVVIHPNSIESGINGVAKAVLYAFRELRTEMAQLHANGHAWYTATFTLTPDGKFKFDFDYDHLPAFDIMPEPDKWLDEFKTYPRPELQAQIQDWIDGRETYQNGGSERLVKRLKTLAAQ